MQKKILDKYSFIYELSPFKTNLIAEPMLYSINSKLVNELQRAGYYVLINEGMYQRLVIKKLKKEEIIHGISV